MITRMNVENAVQQAENNASYKTHQWVKLLWVFLPLTTLLMVLFQTRGEDSAQVVKAIGLILLINFLVLCIFGNFRIKIDRLNLRWSFGMFGWPNWELKIADIRQVEVCQVLWFEGRGIRFTREGMLYNATGSGAVRIIKADGSKIRLGSAEPEILCAQLQARMNALASTVTN